MSYTYSRSNTSAAKYNESESDVPDLETLEYLIQLPIPKETLLNYELWTLQKLGWKLNGENVFFLPNPNIALASDLSTYEFLKTIRDLKELISSVRTHSTDSPGLHSVLCGVRGGASL